MQTVHELEGKHSMSQTKPGQLDLSSTGALILKILTAELVICIINCWNPNQISEQISGIKHSNA